MQQELTKINKFLRYDTITRKFEYRMKLETQQYQTLAGDLLELERKSLF